MFVFGSEKKMKVREKTTGEERKEEKQRGGGKGRYLWKAQVLSRRPDSIVQPRTPIETDRTCIVKASAYAEDVSARGTGTLLGRRMPTENPSADMS